MMEKELSLIQKVQGVLLGFYTTKEMVDNPLHPSGLPKVKEFKDFDYKTGELISTAYKGLPSYYI